MLTSFAPSNRQAAPALQGLPIQGLRMNGAEATQSSRPGPTGTTLHFAQDQEIYCESDEANLFFKVVSGVVRTCKFLYDGRRQIDAFHSEGDVFGVEASAEYSYSAEAVCDCTLVSYRRQEMDVSALEDTGFYRQLFSYAMRSVARAQGHALLLGRKSALEKVVAFLLDWARHSTDNEMIVLAMTRQDIADYLGLTIETVSRTLSLLERDGVIGLMSARQIRIIRPATLQALNS